jgi:uncharacterized membrane protein YhiD involved in acid resistance
MPLNIGWWEIALRLALTVVAGILIGIDRSEHGHAAGLRTTLLVCLAASLSGARSQELQNTRRSCPLRPLIWSNLDSTSRASTGGSAPGS